MLTFYLIHKCFQNASHINETDADFLLEENDWNDYNYHTAYHLHVTKKHTKGNNVYLGPINIMELGQGENEQYRLREKLSGEKTFSRLPENFYSITFSIDLFKGLAQYLRPEERKEFIDGLRLIMKEDDEYYKIVKDDVCFNTSLLRETGMDNFSLQKGRELLLQENMLYDLRKVGITIQYADSDTPVTLDFSGIKDFDSDITPNGVVVFIGKNGSGKSTALYKLAALLYASSGDRDRFMKNLGDLEPTDIGISQLMIFSYSPLDNFLLPGESVVSDLRLWAQGVESRKGRFIFCGLRDVKAEAEKILEETASTGTQDSIRTQTIIFKGQDALAKESKTAYGVINGDFERSDIWNNFVQNMECGQKELFYTAKKLTRYAVLDEAAFLGLSSGYKFFFHAMLHIIAYCEENSLLLFDEPENHLQPPLLSFMLAEIRKILSRRKSVMLIATHSPVVLQETLRKNVRVVSRDGDKVFFTLPHIETFGENFGAISSEVFDLTTDRTRFFDAIDELYSTHNCDKLETVQEVLDLLEEQMGGISSQVIQYVVSKYASGKT